MGTPRQPRVLGPFAGLALATMLLVIVACEEDPNAPYVEIEGGGFVFNYRVADAYYGFVARRLRKLPPGSVLEASFENPDGGAPFILRQTPEDNQMSFSFRSPSVQGVKADRNYRVELRLIAPGSNEVVARYGKSFRSKIDQDIMPDKPLTVGPGYAPNPEARKLPASVP